MVYTPQLFLQINDEVILQGRKITNTTIKMTYPEISIIEAGQLSINFRAELAKGIDPLENKKKEKNNVYVHII
ncbi:hypothetical protein [Gilliamella apis]|uniref:hypothetical protein n=1 Tax=Gilliamella apis TaxID=1970738 RepID=UPI000A356632|nr:hypothetical protein [Gilliamella apis]OTQ56076.1 hypothetical protein B6D21_04245 [Gilliamella apis]